MFRAIAAGFLSTEHGQAHCKYSALETAGSVIFILKAKETESKVVTQGSQANEQLNHSRKVRKNK